MALSPVVNRDIATANPAVAQNKAAKEFSKLTQQTRSGEAASTSGGDGKNTSVKADQQKVQGRGERDQNQGNQHHGEQHSRTVNGVRYTFTDGQLTGRMNVGGNQEATAAVGSQNAGKNGPEMRQATGQAPGSEQLRNPGQASSPPANVAPTMPRLTDTRSARSGETPNKGFADGAIGATSLQNAGSAIQGQQNSGGSSGGGGGQKGKGDKGGDTTDSNKGENGNFDNNDSTGGIGGGDNNRLGATGAMPEEPDEFRAMEESLNEYFGFNTPNFGSSELDVTGETTPPDGNSFVFAQEKSGELPKNADKKADSTDENQRPGSPDDEPALAGIGGGGDRGPGGGNRVGGNGELPPEEPEDNDSDETIDEPPLSLQQRRDQVIANNQGGELSAEIKKNIALTAAKTAGAAIDLFGKVALPSLFTNKFIRSAVSQLMQRGENIPRSEVKQLADAIVGEMIDKALLLEPRMRLLAGATGLKETAAEAIVDTLVEVSRMVPVPGMNQSVYEAAIGFIASRIVENARPERVQTDSPDNERLADATLLHNPTVESLARNSVQVTSAIGNIGKALLTPVGAVLNESSKAAITFGVSALATGLMSGNIQILQFECQDPNLSPEEEKLSRIINQPAKNPITALQVDTPFVDAKYGSKTWLWFNTYASAKPWVFPPAFLPGQEGQPPWVTSADGRLRVMNFAPAGNVNYVAGITTGTRNVATNEFLAFNAPRFQMQALTDFGSTNQRKSPLDLKFSLFGAPISAVRGSEYIFGQARVVQGAIISPATADLSVGTQGLGFTTTSAGLDVIPFAGMATNPSYDPDEKLFNDIVKLKDAVPFLNGK